MGSTAARSPFYQKALAEATDSVPEIVFLVGRAHEEIGDCENALGYFERFSQMVQRWERGEVDWFIGTCAFELATELLDLREVGEEELERALELVQMTVDVGQPRNVQAQAWFQKGEILAELGRCQDAMDAYSQVCYVDQAGTLIDRAQQRFDEIRFGVSLEQYRDGRCR